MKKTVSLLIAMLMIASMGIIPTFASTTETELYSGKEEALSEGALTATAVSGNFVGTNFEPNDAVLAEVTSGIGVQVKKDESGNVYFELDGYNTRTDNYHSHKLYIYDYNEASNSTKLKKYSALVSLPETEVGTTNLFGQQSNQHGDATMFNIKANNGFGVQLKNGGAYYYDKATASYVNFVADGTMQANKYYRVEAIMDIRSRTAHTITAPYYMRAFVYDGDTLLGSTDWVYPADESYRWYLTGRATIIDAYGYSEGSKVLIDEFKGYKVEITPITCTSQVVADDYSSATFTFSEELEVGTVTKENVLLKAANAALDVSDKYEIDYAGGVLTLTFSDLPPSETFNIVLTKDVCAASDGFGLTEEIQISFTTPADSFADSLSTVAFNPVDGEEIVAGSEVVASITLSNTTNRAREYLLLATSWNSENECVDIESVYGFIEPGDTENLTIPAVTFQDAESVIRVSLLDNWYNTAPVGTVVTYQQ